jgi:hypothetical protein
MSSAQVSEASTQPARPSPPKDEGADAERIAHADEVFVGQRNQGVGADDLLDGVDQAVDDVGIQADGDEMDENLAVHGGLEQAAAAGERLAQGVGIGEVAVMADGEAAELEFREQRLDVAQHRLAGGGIAVMADGARAGQAGHDLGVAVIVADQP